MTLDRLAVVHRYRLIATIVFVVSSLAMLIQGYRTERFYRAHARLLVDDERTTAIPGLGQNAYYERPKAYLQTQYRTLLLAQPRLPERGLRSHGGIDVYVRPEQYPVASAALAEHGTGPFDERPRLPFQLAECVRRSARFVARREYLNIERTCS